MRKIFKKLNNKAFTLVEILLAVAVLAIATISIGAIIISTQNNTAKMFSESELQQQVVEAQSTLHNEIIGTNIGLKYWIKDGKNENFILSNEDKAGYEKLVAFYNLDVKSYELTKTYYLWNSEEKVIHVASLSQPVTKDPNKDIDDYDVDTNIESVLREIETNQDVSWSTMATQVETFSLDVAHYDNSRLISFNFEIKQGNNVYPADDTIYMRNKIAINGPLYIEKYHTIKLTKPLVTGLSYTYDGSVHAPVESNYIPRYMKRTDESTTSAVNAGTYTITYKLLDKDSTQWEDGSTADITYTWTIGQRAVGLVWGESRWTYDGKVHSTTCSLTNVVSGDDPGLVLANNSIGPNVGTVICKASVMNSNYYIPSDNTIQLIIGTKEASGTVVAIDRTWNGSNQAMTSESNLEGGVVHYYISTSSSTPNSTQVNNPSCVAQNAGTYHIWYKIKATNSQYHDSNVFYLGTAQMYKAKTAQVSSSNKTYNGSNQAGITGSYVVLSGTYEAVNAGTYTGYAVPDSNHLWADGTSTQKTFQWVINKASSHIIAPTPKTLTYNGAYQVLINAGSTKYGQVEYRIGTNGSWSTELPTAINAGTYKIYYYSTGDMNHESTSKDAYITVTIQRAKSASASGKTLTYTGSKQNGVVGTNVTWSGIIEATAAGTYKAIATPTNNFAWSDGDTNSREIVWEIQKAAGQVTAPTAKTLIYNGNSQILINAGSTSWGTIYYKLDNGSWSTNLPSAVNAGTYKVYYYSSGDANHNATSQSNYITVTIGLSKTASVTKSDRTYTGSAQNGYTVANNVNLSGDYNKTAAGTYTFYATPKTNYAWSDGSTGQKTFTWTMNRAKTASVTKSDRTYNGSAQNGYSTKTNVTISGDYSKTAAGTYTFYATPNTNYAWSDGSTEQRTFTWTMSKASGQITAPTAKSLTYNGSAQTLINAGSTSYGSVYYKVGNGSWSTSLPTATNAGSYTVYYYSSGDANHNATSQSAYITVTINLAKTASVTQTGRTYNGYAQNGYTVANNVNLSGNYNKTAAGTYTFYATPKTNYAWSDGSTGQKTFTWTMSKASGQIKAPTAKSLTYNGSAQTLINAGSTSYGSVYYKVGSGSWSTSLPTATNAGSYTVYYYSSGDANHNATSQSNYITVTIGRLNTASVSSTNRTYNGYAQNGYSSKANVSLSGNYSATVVGSYTFYATPTSNYAWSDGSTGQKTFNWSISKASGQVTAPTAKSLTYNGYAQTLINAGSSSTGTMYYKLAGGSYSTSLPSATNAGTYTVYYYSAGDSNHNNTSEQSIQITIGRLACCSVSVANRTYNETGYQNGYSSYCSHLINWSGTWSAMNAGTYTFYCEPDSNHAWSDGTTGVKGFTWHMYRLGHAWWSNEGWQGTNSTDTATYYTYTYTGGTITGIRYADVATSVSGTAVASAPGTYYLTLTPTANYCWGDGTTGSITVTWVIQGGYTLGTRVNASNAYKYQSEDNAVYNTGAGSKFGASWYDATKLYICKMVKVPGFQAQTGVFTAADANSVSPLISTNTTTSGLIAWTRFDQLSLS